MISTQDINAEISRILARMNLIKTKEPFYSPHFPALSYSTLAQSAIFNTVNNLNMAEPGYMQTRNTWLLHCAVGATDA